MLSQLRAGIDVVCPVRRERSGGADAHADTQPSRLDRRDEGLYAVLCRQFGISRKTGYKILTRYNEIGLEGLTGRSRRP
jgi:hypothetical protein